MNQTTSLAYLVAPFAGWIVAQSIKMFLVNNKNIGLSDALRSGGMPSSHSAFMSAVAMVVGLNVGFDTAAFAITLAITSIVLYDATGVRRTTGEQTDAILKIAKKTGVKVDLRHDARGHKPAEVVVGVIVGAVVGAITSYIL